MQSSPTKVFEDNTGAIESAKVSKLRPWTKHLAIQHHHFWEWTVKGLDGEEPRIEVSYLSTDLQEADITTKPLAKYQLNHCEKDSVDGSLSAAKCLQMTQMRLY